MRFLHFLHLGAGPAAVKRGSVPRHGRVTRAAALSPKVEDRSGLNGRAEGSLESWVLSTVRDLPPIASRTQDRDPGVLAAPRALDRFQA